MTKLIIVCIVALILHMLTKWNESWMDAKLKNVHPLGFFEFLLSIKPQAAMAVLGAAGSFIIAGEFGWLDPDVPASFGVSVACGYMGSSVFKKFVDIYQKFMEQKK